jgi:NAD(P)H-dependent FMN reductase
MIPVLDALKTADALVLASPVYFWGVTAQLKLAIDRTYALLRTERATKRAALLLTCGSRVGASVLMFENMCEFSRWENAGVIIETGLREPDAIKGREVLEKAKALGREI